MTVTERPGLGSPVSQRSAKAWSIGGALLLLVAFFVGYSSGHAAGSHEQTDTNTVTFSGVVVLVDSQGQAVAIRPDDRGPEITGLLAHDGEPLHHGEHVTGTLVRNPNVVFVN